MNNETPTGPSVSTRQAAKLALLHLTEGNIPAAIEHAQEYNEQKIRDLEVQIRNLKQNQAELTKVSRVLRPAKDNYPT